MKSNLSGHSDGWGNHFHESDPMAVIGSVGRKAVVALAMTSALAGCSSVEHETKIASAQASAQTGTADGEAAVEYNSTLPVTPQSGSVVGAPAPGSQPTVALVKMSRLVVPVPAEAEIAPVQTLAMSSPTMPAIVALKSQPVLATLQPPAPAGAPVQVASLTPPNAAASSQAEVFPPVPASPGSPSASEAAPLVASIGAKSTPKSSRLVSPPVAAAVASGQISPAAAEAIALDEPQLTPDMVALQSVIPIPRPDTTTLAYAAQPKAVSAMAAIDQRLEYPPAPGEPVPSTASGASPELVKLIKRYAGLYGVPESLVHRVVHRESKYDPKAYHKNGYWGLMQIKYATAKSMGYQGKPEGLLDAETNLKYAIKYLRGAWLVADNQNDNAIKLYARGYYNDAKRKDMLEVLSK
jgi:soluble lytic murein transglycosylase-like protein